MYLDFDEHFDPWSEHNHLVNIAEMISSTSPLQQQQQEDLSRRSSLSIKQSPRKNDLENVKLVKEIPLKHLHIGSYQHNNELDMETISWMREVEIQSPAIMYSNLDAKITTADLWSAKQYKVNAGAKLLIRGIY